MLVALSRGLRDVEVDREEDVDMDGEGASMVHDGKLAVLGIVVNESWMGTDWLNEEDDRVRRPDGVIIATVAVIVELLDSLFDGAADSVDAVFGSTLLVVGAAFCEVMPNIAMLLSTACIWLASEALRAALAIATDATLFTLATEAAEALATEAIAAKLGFRMEKREQ